MVAQWEWAVIDQEIARHDSDLLPSFDDVDMFKTPNRDPKGSWPLHAFVTSGIQVTIAAARRGKLWPVEPLGGIGCHMSPYLPLGF